MVHKINDPIFNYWNNIAQKYWDFLQVNLFLQLNLKIIVKHHHIQSNLGCMLYSNLQILASIIQKPWWGQAHILAILTTMTPNDLEGNNQMTPDSRSIQDRHPMTKFVYWSFHPSIFCRFWPFCLIFFCPKWTWRSNMQSHSRHINYAPYGRICYPWFLFLKLNNVEKHAFLLFWPQMAIFRALKLDPNNSEYLR